MDVQEVEECHGSRGGVGGRGGLRVMWLAVVVDFSWAASCRVEKFEVQLVFQLVGRLVFLV